MVPLSARCDSCAFDNPPGWVACARCGHLLGPRGGGDATTGQHEAGAGRRPAEEAQTALFRADLRSLHNAQPLLGQDAVLTSIRAAQKKAFGDGHAHMLSVLGPRGSGRTRLLVAAGDLAAHSWPNVRLRYAASRPEEDGPYAPFSRLLLQRFAITPASSPSRVRAEMAATVADVLDGLDSARITEVTHLLGHIAGVPFPDSPYLQRGSKNVPDDLLTRAAQALSTFMSFDTGATPTLLLLDDMSTAEADSLSLLAALAPIEAPLTCILSGDAALATELQARIPAERFSQAPIAPLDAAAITELTHMLVPELRDPPGVFLEALHHRSQGNPAALSELLRALREGGLFRATEGGLQVDLDRMSSGELPLTLDDAVRARLVQLTRAERRLIEYAAVVGERFWEGALLALSRSEHPPPMPQQLDPLRLFDMAADELELHDTLRLLEEKRFIVRITDSPVSGLSEYTFQFAGTRAVVYEDLTEKVRATRHAVVARWLSTVGGLEGVPALIAPHFARAGMNRRAARAYLRAAEAERLRRRTTMALRLVDKALSLLVEDDAARRIEAFHARGSLLTTLGRYDEAVAAFEDMLQAAFRLGARGPAGAALNRIARIHRQRGELNTALTYLKASLSLFRAAADERGVASTYDDMAQIHRFRCQPEPAFAAAKEALEIRVRVRDKRGQAVSLNTLGNIELDRGNFEDAEARLNLARKIRHGVGDHEGVAQTEIGLGRLALQRGRPEDAIEILSRALDAAREMDNHRFQSYLLCVLGEALMTVGQEDAARAALTEARDLAHAMRDQRALCEIERNRGLLALQRGEESATRRLEHALSLATQYGSQQALGLAHMAVARLHSQTVFDAEAAGGGEADTHYQKCIEHLSASDAKHEVARARAEYGLHLLEKGRPSDALTHLKRAVPELKARGMQAKAASAALSELSSGPTPTRNA